MVNENWVKTDVLTDWQKRAKKLAEDRMKWEQEQIKKGKVKKLIPHPDIKGTFILKFV